jgi:hypothetical protein
LSTERAGLRQDAPRRSHTRAPAAALHTEAATRLRVDVGRLLDQAEAEFGSDEEERLLRGLLERAEAGASARDGDVVGEAELRWAR